MSACWAVKPHSTITSSILRGDGGVTVAKGIATSKSKSGLGSAILNHDILRYRKYTVATARMMCARTTIRY
jgi:hypothetical protein